MSGDLSKETALLEAVYALLPPSAEAFLDAETAGEAEESIVKAFAALDTPEADDLDLGTKLTIFGAAIFSRLTMEELGETHPTSIAGCYLSEALMCAFMAGVDEGIKDAQREGKT